MDTIWTPDGRLSRGERSVLLLLPLLTFLFLALLRWERFGDLRVDFGQDVYAAWQILEGKDLYTDLAYFKGPFSPHWNALILLLFGVSIRTIMVTNMLIALSIAYGIRHITKLACGPVVGSIMGCAFLLVFAFSEESSLININNFVTPFVHELTHGIAFSLLTFITLESGLRRRSSVLIALSGLAFGFAWMTRIEVAASLTAACMAWVWCAHRERLLAKNALVTTGMFLVPAIIVWVVTVLLLAQHMPVLQALRSAFASLDAAITTPVASSPFFQMISGRDHIFSSLGLQIVSASVIALWMLCFYWSAEMWSKRAWVFAATFCIAGFIIVVHLSMKFLPFMYGSFLTIAIIPLTIIFALRILRDQGNADHNRVVLVAAIFSLFMLAKIFFSPIIRFYGFAHAMPAYLLFLSVVLIAPANVCRRKLGEKGAQVFAALLICAILIDIGAKTYIDQYLAHTKNFAVGAGADRFYVQNNNHNEYFREFLSLAPTLIPRGSTLTVIPEGAMINFLLRVPSGVSVMNYMMTEYVIFGRDRIEGELYANRPDFILLTHKDTTEFGYPLYGKVPEYGSDVIAWMNEEYEQIALFGEQPLVNIQSEGVALWKRRDFKEIRSEQ